MPPSAPALLIGDPPAEAPDHHVARRATRFPEMDAIPAPAAIAELETNRRKGSTYLVVPPTVSAWLSERPALKVYVENRYRRLVDDDACRIYDLRRSPISSFLDAILAPGEPVMMVTGDGTLGAEDRELHSVDSSLSGNKLSERIATVARAGVRYLVLPEMSPWGPIDDGFTDHLEARFTTVARRAGVCDVFYVGPEIANE